MAFRHVLALAMICASVTAHAKSTPPVGSPKPAKAKVESKKAQPKQPSYAGSKEAGFHLDRLPQGKNVTIPRPATTFIPLSSTVNLTATDTPQSLSLKPINVKTGGNVSGLRVSIMNRESGKLQYVELKPGMPFVYSFEELGSVTVIPQANGVAIEGLSLQVESDKPLEIAH